MRVPLGAHAHARYPDPHPSGVPPTTAVPPLSASVVTLNAVIGAGAPQLNCEAVRYRLDETRRARARAAHATSTAQTARCARRSSLRRLARSVQVLDLGYQAILDGYRHLA